MRKAFKTFRFVKPWYILIDKTILFWAIIAFHKNNNALWNESQLDNYISEFNSRGSIKRLLFVYLSVSDLYEFKWTENVNIVSDLPLYTGQPTCFALKDNSTLFWSGNQKNNN